MIVQPSLSTERKDHAPAEEHVIFLRIGNENSFVKAW
jgi:hypothetical protein